MTRYPHIVAALFVLLGAGASNADAQQIQPAQVDLVNSWYVRYLGRGADQDGINYWCRQLACGKPAIVVISGILGSDEYYRRNGCCPNGFVLGLYADVLGRGASPQEVQSWAQQLNRRRMTRQRLAQNFLQAAAVELASAPLRPQGIVVPQPPQNQFPQEQPPPPRPLPYP